MPRGRKRIFISYRRSESAGYAGRLRDALRPRLRVPIFMDVADLAPGTEFPEKLAEELRSCGAVLAIIGPQWLTALRTRGDSIPDYVRIELAQALTSGDVIVVPVLVQGATLPSADELPDDLKELTDRQTFSIRDDRWNEDVDYLTRKLRQQLGLWWIPTWVLAAGGVLLAAGVYVLLNRPPAPAPYDRESALETTMSAVRSAAWWCGSPGEDGACPIAFAFQPDGTVEQVYFDSGSCRLKATAFGECLLKNLAGFQIHPFNDLSKVELGVDLRVDADGDVVAIKPY